jgi:signal transduction histidine kinase
LWAVLTAVRESTGYPDFLGHLARAVTESVPSDRTTVYILSRRRGTFLPAADYGTPGPVVEAFASRGYAPGSIAGEELLRAGRSLLAVRGDAPEMEETLVQARLHALLLVPLVHAGETEGVLSCGVEDAPAFSTPQVQLLEQLAPHLALLIRSARLEAGNARLAERRTRLASLASDVLGAADAQAMALRVCAAARAIFRATRADLLILEGDELVGRAFAGAGTVEGVLRRPLAGSPMLSEALRERRVLVENAFMTGRFAGVARARGLEPAAVLAVPLADGEGQLGVLLVSDLYEPYRFGPQDADDASLLGKIATDTIRKGLLVEALRRASTAKSEFLASVSHDLRTPLNVIVGYTDLLAEETFGPVTDEQLDTLHRIHRTASGQLALIDDLLDLARIEQGKIAFRLRPVHVGELVGSIREMMDALLRDRPVSFEVDVATDAVARTDGERLRQVLVNLLANAAKFTRVGSVRLSALRALDKVEIAVADTGPGMEREVASQVLEPFVHGGDASSGSGLGLAIVARLLDVLGGRLRIESQPGAGTTMRVELPAE